MNYTLYELWEYLIKSIHEKKYSKCTLNKHEKWHLSKIPIVLIFCKYDPYLMAIKNINFIQLLDFSKKSKNDENFNPVSKLLKRYVLALIIKRYNLEMVNTLDQWEETYYLIISPLFLATSKLTIQFFLNKLSEKMPRKCTLNPLVFCLSLFFSN